jgi:superfamily II DNA or RNA helicase
MAEPTKTTGEFERIYVRLSHLQRICYQVSCINFAPMTLYQMVTTLKLCGTKDDYGNAIKQQSVLMTLNMLVSKRLLKDEQSGFSNHRTLRPTSRYLENGAYRAFQETYIDKLIEALRIAVPLPKWENDPESPKLCVREARIGIYKSDLDSVNKYLAMLSEIGGPEFSKNVFWVFNVFFKPYLALEKLQTFPVVFQYQALASHIQRRLDRLLPVGEFVDVLKTYERNSEENLGPHFRSLLRDVYLKLGELDKVSRLAERDSRYTGSAITRACIAGMRNDDNASMMFEEALKELRKAAGKRKLFFVGQSATYCLLGLIQTGDPRCYEQARKHLKTMSDDRSVLREFTAVVFESYLDAASGSSGVADRLLEEAEMYESMGEMFAIDVLLLEIVIYWMTRHSFRQARTLQAFYDRARQNGYRWLALEFAALLAIIDEEKNQYAEFVSQVSQETGIRPIVTRIKPEEHWKRALKGLGILAKQSANGKSKESGDSRLVYFVDFEHHLISPKEQKSGKGGKWSKGRPVALKRLYNGELTCMTGQDRQVARAIHFERGTYYQPDYYGWNFHKALLELAGHPLLFVDEHQPRQIQLIRDKPELSIKRRPKGGYEVALSQRNVLLEGLNVDFIEESPTRFRVLDITEAHRQIAELLGTNALFVPPDGEKELSEVIGNLASLITVHSELTGVDFEVPTVDADSRIHFQLFPLADGLRLEVVVRPFPHAGPYMKPGQGGQTVLAEIEGTQKQAHRDLALEVENATHLVSRCPSIPDFFDFNLGHFFETPEACLELLLDLHELGDEAVIEWPEGERFRVTRVAQSRDMSLRVKKERDWFGLSGELQLDESLVISLQELLKKLDSAPGRFIQLDDKRFIALTEEFKRRLEEVRLFSDVLSHSVRLHPSALLAVRGFIDEAGTLEADDAWNAQVKNIDASLEYRPALPSTFRAELRSYQDDGFRWLSQLAKWGVGACLADDMGLGKTIQALAVLVDLAEQGPALVVAPASVLMNWEKEAHRFAPTLNVKVFGGKKRDELIYDLQAFDLVICSYGLLQQEAELLAEQKWRTIILDEAQAIKNVGTKRSKAAMGLQGEFKMITTGTPIENHLGELWNLFHFLNPGLLGSLQQFNDRFAVPIERYDNRYRKKQLKKLVTPFVLRRLKTEVLDELPPKTEITLSVEMSKEERALYETLRLKSLNRLGTEKGNAGERYMRILAEIMRLRRACCHSRLVLPDSPITSTKLDLFGELIDELRENRHKALVFSQFVDHLAIIRETVEHKQIPYQYLDGSTPIKERRKRVEAFQRGEGDLFLISLRAGGTGLNLTAADYVIHMDPWWNPAVEDQASDRAHRIGQEQPVTIYRLVASDTIEERIVDLHKEKRDLADSLLDDTAKSGKMTADELLELIMQR